MKIQKIIDLGGLLLVVVFMTACSSLTRSDKPATSTWLLKPYESSAGAETGLPVSRVTISVQATPGLDSDWVLTLSTDSQLSHYAGARWVDHVPELVKSITGRTLEASGRFDVVSAHGGGHEDCDLSLEVQEFYAELGSAGQTTAVQLVINGQYQCQSAETVSIQLRESVPVHDERMSVIVAAFQQAVDNAMKDLLVQL